MMVDRLPDRMQQKIRVEPRGHTTPCWLWVASRNEHGYGMVSWSGRQRRAHRVIYSLLVGPIPEGLTLDHLCRVRHCVNPDHLEPVTLLENHRRGYRTTLTHCKRGHEFTPENTYIQVRGNGRMRCCRSCGALRQRERLQRIRDAKAAD